MRGDVGQLRLHLLWKERILKYWHRLCSEDIPVLLKQAMVQTCQLRETSNNCWISKLKTFFNMAGFSSLLSSSGCDAEVQTNILTRYTDQYLQIWNSELSRVTSKSGSGGNKLRSYGMFTKEFKMELY